MPTMITLVDSTIPVASDFNSNYTALNQAIGTSTTITSYTAGDMLYSSASNTLAKLAIGSALKKLAVNTAGTAPNWVFDELGAAFTAVGNVTTGEDNLQTVTLAAGQMSVNGHGVVYVGWGTGANNGNAKTLKTYLGSTTLGTFSLPTSAAVSWLTLTYIIRVTATAQRAVTAALYNTALSVNATSPTETLANSLTLKHTGEATDTNDIIQTGTFAFFVNGA